MKFKKIIMTNFMRYKGKNELVFSCDNDKNVTIILGDNTFGKTTIAQAFRWGLYGKVKKTNYIKNIDDIVLLNNEVISLMDKGDIQKVQVEIVVEDGPNTYTFIRSQEFRKVRDDNEDLTVAPFNKIPELSMTKNGGDIISNMGNKNKNYKVGCVQNTINTMFPEKLSDYLFFDGERWSENDNRAVDIEKSINTIIGLSSLTKMTEHLKLGNRDMSANVSVISKLNRKIKVSSSEEEKVRVKIEQIQRDIETNVRKIADTKEEIEMMTSAKDDLYEILNNNRSTEEDQKNLKHQISRNNREQSYAKETYTDIVKKFSHSDKLFVSELLPSVEKIISQVDLEGKDIPGVTSDTIDWLLENKICLCGEELVEGEKHYESLKKLREEVYPNKIGGPAKLLKEKLNIWANDSKNLLEDIKEKGNSYEVCLDEIEDSENEIHRLESRIDKKLNLEDTRKKYKYYEGAIRNAEYLIKKLEDSNSELEKKLTSNKEQLKNIARQNKENESVLRAIAYAEAIYDRAKMNVEIRQRNMFNELNEIIKENFEKMFNSTEKYAALGKDFKMHVYYKNQGIGGQSTGKEEKYLSEGEVTAINFVFIVSILEFAKRQKEKEDDENSVLSLPLVLDAPFSKLGTQNIGLISKQLPEFAEQVIIFMLDKDWEASGLEQNTLPEYCYRVEREYSDVSSTIANNGGAL